MKKLFALLMAALMVVTMFAGCGSAETPATDAAGGEAPATDAAPTAGTIKIGSSGPLTNDYAVYGKAVEYGLTLAFEEINALGGLQFELRVEDDEADAEMAVNAYNTLMDWGMQIMAGPTTSGSAAAAAAECAADGVFMLTPSASDAAVITAGDNVFQICFTDPNQGVGSADFISSHNLATKVGVIYDSSNPYSVGIYTKFMEQAAVVGLEVVAEEAFTADNKADLSTQVTKCQEAGCDLVFLPIYAAEAAQVLTCADKIDYNPAFFGCDGLDGILATEGFDPALAEGVMLLTPFDASSSDPQTQEFVANYTAKFGLEPNQFAADAYDVAYAIYQACTAAGVTADMSAEEICETMIAQFTSMSFDGLTGDGMTWAADGAVSKLPMAVKIENGVYVGVE
ncbi:MAG: ABC transporter substrate-binding protein [Oscillospiraceae bacterium]|nr:ABC transporter substrate-binding protein [Oscillospiraceae bacterium]